jgi:ADP-heptose:LPS heptosyltransferase
LGRASADQWPRVEGEYFVLGNGGSAPAKRWPAERWRGAIGALRERHPALRFVQLGVASDPLLDGVEDLRGTSIDESHRVLRGARGCLTNDSFLAHLSAAADCATIVLFGPTCPIQFRPLGGSHVIPLGGHGFRTPCTRNLCRLTPRSPCRAFPGTKRVIDAIEQTLARAPRPA